MKRNIFPKVVIAILFSLMFNSLTAQSSQGKVQNEIKETLNQFNTVCKNADLEKALSMFDDSPDIIVVGSADGEISKGKDEARKWIGGIFGFAGFSWEMDRIDISSNGKTAWVFMNGKMIVDFKQGGKKVTPYRFTGIMVKKNGSWKWRLFDGSVPQSE